MYFWLHNLCDLHLPSPGWAPPSWTRPFLKLDFLVLFFFLINFLLEYGCFTMLSVSTVQQKNQPYTDIHPPAFGLPSHSGRHRHEAEFSVLSSRFSLVIYFIQRAFSSLLWPSRLLPLLSIGHAHRHSIAIPGDKQCELLLLLRAGWTHPGKPYPPASKANSPDRRKSWAGPSASG